MTITATIAKRKPTIGVKLNSNTGSIQSTTPVTIQTQNASGASNRLDRLNDVNATTETHGATLVYNEANDTYEVKKLDLSNVTGDLDGGIF